MGVISELYRFIELSQQMHPDLWERREELTELEREYIQSLRTVQKIDWLGSKPEEK